MELSISDPEIVKQSGCLVMADNGFVIQDELASVGAKLTLRHFMNGKKQFTKEESDHKKKRLQVREYTWKDICRD